MIKVINEKILRIMYMIILWTSLLLGQGLYTPPEREEFI